MIGSFLSFYDYLHILVGCLCLITTLTMFIVNMKGPAFVMTVIDKPRFHFLFTFRGRYIIDLLVSLFLFAMGIFGVIMASITLGLIFGIRFVGVKHPEAFGMIFRQPTENADDDTYADGTYADGDTYAESTIESGTAR